MRKVEERLNNGSRWVGHENPKAANQQHGKQRIKRGSKARARARACAAAGMPRSTKPTSGENVHIPEGGVVVINQTGMCCPRRARIRRHQVLWVVVRQGRQSGIERNWSVCVCNKLRCATKPVGICCRQCPSLLMNNNVRRLGQKSSR